MVETNLVIVEEVLDDNIKYDDRRQKWIVPIIEEGKTFVDLAKNSPEVLRLIQAASNRIADDVIDEQIPPSNTYLSSEYWSRGIAKDLQRQVNNYIEKNVIPPEDWKKAHEEMHNEEPAQEPVQEHAEESAQEPTQGGKKSKTYKRKKRTKNKSLKKRHR
jgi:hypothetical protein